MSDGLTVPFALAAGLSGAVDAAHIVITAGLAEIAAMSSVFKGHAAVPQPGDWRTISVEVRFTQDRVVGAAVEVNDQTSRFDLDAAAGFDELAVEVLRLGLGK